MSDTEMTVYPLCDHEYGERVGYDRTNKVLGTYDRGYTETCLKCGHINKERTSYNNWSGD
jgi:hypothetical protein